MKIYWEYIGPIYIAPMNCATRVITSMVYRIILEVILLYFYRKYSSL